jgi:hypothetical protein
VHVDASSIELGAVLAQPEEGDIDHPIYFSSIKLSKSQHNYNTTEREGLVIWKDLGNITKVSEVSQEAKNGLNR